MNADLKSIFLDRWKKYFPGAPLPVAFFYSHDLHNATPANSNKNHHCVIADFTRALHGESLALGVDTTGCMGGKRYCGFSTSLSSDFEYFLSFGIEGKTRGERYKKDPETVTEWMKNTPTVKAPAEWLILKPFDKLDTQDEPVGIVFFATPDVLAGLFTLANYDRPDLYGVKSPFSAGCGSIVQYTRLENEKENPDCILGMFDSSARPYVKAEMLSFSVPMKRFETLVSYMDESFLITPTWDVMKRRIQNRLTMD